MNAAKRSLFLSFCFALSSPHLLLPQDDQAASVMAAFVYQAAMLDARFPRKPVKALIKPEAAVRDEQETSTTRPPIKNRRERGRRAGTRLTARPPR